MAIPDPQLPRRRSSGMGGPFVILLILGIAVGVAMRQPTLGFLGGTAAGIAVGVLLYLRDRRA
ncbi:hypothetical protein ACFSC3_09340 [Sphingomonas floccifaciens]|uniref:Uncharacterized protein n=1 Tax=Sphingomonas floccifaciens TaxID=1844115 RepID=A0ABW4NCQ5_9SPHN